MTEVNCQVHQLGNFEVCGLESFELQSESHHQSNANLHFWEVFLTAKAVFFPITPRGSGPSWDSNPQPSDNC